MILILVVLSLLDKKYDFVIQKYKGFIIDKTVVLFSFVSGILLILLFRFYFPNFKMEEVISSLILIWGLTILSIADVKKRIVPSEMVLFLFLMWLITGLVFLITDYRIGFIFFLKGLLGGGLIGVIFLVSYFLSKGRLGGGDVKLIFLMGLYLPFDKLMMALFLGFLAALLYSLGVVFRKKNSLKEGLPLVPFLFLGSVISILGNFY